MTSTSPSSRRASRYLARRSSASTLRPSSLCGKCFGKRKAQILAPLLDALETIADQHREKAHAHGLDFGKLRHQTRLPQCKTIPLQCNNSLNSGLALLSHRMSERKQTHGGEASFGFAAVAPEERQGLVNEVFARGRAPLRPDERPDVGRAAPFMEGRADRLARAPEGPRPMLCSTWLAAPATSPRAS